MKGPAIQRLAVIDWEGVINQLYEKKRTLAEAEIVE